MSDRLAGKVALITGAGSGIGLGIAQRFIAEGAVVEVSDRSVDGREVVERAGASFRQVDVSDAEAVQDWVSRCAATHGQVDVVVTAAGYELVADALELSVDSWDWHMDVMLRGTFVTFKAALEPMLAGGGGSLIAIGSNLAFAALPRFTSYVTAKHGVVGLVRAMAADFGPRGIRVNALCPGPTWTPLIERQLIGVPDADELLAEWEKGTMLNRLGTTEEIAAGAVFLASDEASFVTGSALMIDGGYTAK